jgi:hypothetical protein
MVGACILFGGPSVRDMLLLRLDEAVAESVRRANGLFYISKAVIETSC